jgi:hypothetical protein
MNNIEQQITKFKFELSKEWRMLQTNKWRRPKWIKFPNVLEDPKWFQLSDPAKALWINILLIASESRDFTLPPTEILLHRLRILGNHYHIVSVSRLIDELNQCGWLVKTTPELQSYRVTDKKENIQKKEKRLGDEVREERKVPTTEDKVFVEYESPEWEAWCKATGKFFRHQTLRVDGNLKWGRFFRTAWPTSEFKLNGGSAPISEAIG